MQTFAAHLERLPGRDAAHVREVVGERTFLDIEAAGLLGWLPIEVNLRCTQAVAERLGPERTHEFFRTLLLGAAESPLLRGLVQGVLRVAVTDPGLYLPWVAKGYEIMFRDAGRWNVLQRWTGRALTELAGLPAECVGHRFWIDSVASGTAALLDLAALTGTVTVKEASVEGRRVVFLVDWSRH